MKKTLIITLSIIYSLSIYAQKGLAKEVSPFTKLEISGNMEVDLKQANAEKIQLNARDIEPSDIVFTEKNGVLKVSPVKNKERKAERIRIIIFYKQIEELTISSGGELNVDSVFTAPNLKIDAGSGCVIRIKLDVGKLDALVGQGATVTPVGKVESQEVRANAGGVYSAYDLTSKDTYAKSTSGSVIKIRATESLDANASMGGIVSYIGTPKKVSKNESFGGSVSQVEE